MDREKTYAKHCCAFLTTTCTMIMRFAFFEASPLFAKSDRMAKRMKRTKRIKTDFYSACGG